MRRTTIKLPDDLDAELRYEADRRGVTVSALTRDAIAAYLHTDRPLRSIGAGHSGERRLRMTGAGRSGRSDISVRIEELLREAARERDPHS